MTFTAPGISVNTFNRLFNRNKVYLTLFEPDPSQAWYGNIKKFGVCEDTSNTACTFGELIDANGNAAVETDILATEFR